VTDTIVCIASGPSLTQEDVDFCRDRARVLVVNNNYAMAPWADWLYAGDYQWWRCHLRGSHGNRDWKAKLDAFTGERWTLDRKAAQDFGLRWIEDASGPNKAMRLCCEPGKVYNGANSGFAAINLAWHFGARRIVLLGYDMQRTGGVAHWFGDHPPELSSAADYPAFRSFFPLLAADLAADGVAVINCSRATALECFKRSTVQEVLGGTVANHSDRAQAA